MNTKKIPYEDALSCEELKKNSLWIRHSSFSGNIGEIISIEKIENITNYYNIYFNKNRSRYNATFSDHFIPYFGNKKAKQIDEQYIKDNK